VSHTSFEALAINIKLPSDVLVAYCRLSSKHCVEISTSLTDFQSVLTVAANTLNNFIITGDFNIHINKESDTNRIRFMDYPSKLV